MKKRPKGGNHPGAAGRAVGARFQRARFSVKSIQSFNRARWKCAPTVLYDEIRHAISGLSSLSPSSHADTFSLMNSGPRLLNPEFWSRADRLPIRFAS